MICVHCINVLTVFMANILFISLSYSSSILYIICLTGLKTDHPITYINNSPFKILTPIPMIRVINLNRLCLWFGREMTPFWLTHGRDVVNSWLLWQAVPWSSRPHSDTHDTPWCLSWDMTGYQYPRTNSWRLDGISYSLVVDRSRIYQCPYSTLQSCTKGRIWTWYLLINFDKRIILVHNAELVWTWLMR